MGIYKKLCLFFLTIFLSSSFSLYGQSNSCGLEIINTEFILNSEYEITILVEVQSNSIEAEGVAYLVNNLDIESLGLDIFWTPASFSVHTDDEIFQIAISGTSTSIISLPDDLIVNGRIAFSFIEEPQVTTDIKLLEEGAVLVDIDIITLDVDTATIIIDSSVVSIDTFLTPIDTFLTPIDTFLTPIDTFLTPIDTFLTPIDTFYIEMDSLILLTDSLFSIDDSEVLFEDSVLLNHSIILGDSILIGNQLIFLNDIPNPCEVNYICQLPVSTEQQVIDNEAKITNDDIQKDENEIDNSDFGSIFDNEFLEMDELSFNVFPNPTVEYFYVHTNLNEQLNILIYSVTGNIVFEKTMDSNFTKIDTQNLPDGLYFVLIENNAEVRHLTKLIVK